MTLIIMILWAERGFIKSSTVKIFRESGLKNILNLNFIYMYVYARWPDKYLAIARRLLPKNKGNTAISDKYHAKILTPQLAKKIIKVDKAIPIRNLEKIIPYPTARKIVLDNPVDIVVIDCPCRASSPQPCEPSKVCMVIGKPFTDFMLEHNPSKSKRITPKEALELLEIVHNKGCIHSAFFKEACLDRFYVICNCCKCCCLGLEAMVKHGIPMMAASGYIAKIDEKSCIYCGVCQKNCPFEAINDSYQIIAEKCMGCGVCLTFCNQNAIILERDESKGIPLDVSNL